MVDKWKFQQRAMYARKCALESAFFWYIPNNFPPWIHRKRQLYAANDFPEGDQSWRTTTGFASPGQSLPGTTGFATRRLLPSPFHSRPGTTNFSLGVQSWSEMTRSLERSGRTKRLALVVPLFWMTNLNIRTTTTMIMTMRTVDKIISECTFE